MIGVPGRERYRQYAGRSRRYHMKTVGVICSTIVLLMALPLPAISAQGDSKNPSFTVTEAKTTTEKVVSIDYQTRKVTLRNDEGSDRTVQVGEDVSNLNRVKIGDEVTVETHQTISVEVQPGPGETMNIGAESQTNAVPGAKPSGTRIIEGKLKTRVESIDYQARTITFKNRKSILTTYKVDPRAKRFDEIRRGDMLVVEYFQKLTLSVK
jgi:hypothetical protein